MHAEAQPVIAITGGSQGLGYALGETLLEHGFQVALCARTKEALLSAVASLSAHGPVKGFVGDIADPFFRSTFIDETTRHFGRLDALVNNASTLGDLPLPKLASTNIANLRHVFEVNAFAPVMLIQAALPHLARTQGIVLNISSDAAVAGYEGWGVYGSSKAALDLISRTFANESAAQGVRFYAVDPSDMQTAMHEAASPGDEGLADPADVARVLSQLFHPLTSRGHAFDSGQRLQVSGERLIVKGGD